MADTPNTGAGLNLASSALNVGGGIANGLIANEGERIKAQYQKDLQELNNDSTLTKAEYNERLAKINAIRDAAEDAYKSGARKDYLGYGIVGLLLVGVFVIAYRLLTKKRS